MKKNKKRKKLSEKEKKSTLDLLDLISKDNPRKKGKTVVDPLLDPATDEVDLDSVLNPPAP